MLVFWAVFFGGMIKFIALVLKVTAIILAILAGILIFRRFL